jgi:hypothetical protein
VLGVNERKHTVQYPFRVEDGEHLVLEDAARITDAYRAAIRLRLGRHVHSAEFEAEERRLGTEVKMLTPGGWDAVPVARPAQ